MAVGQKSNLSFLDGSGVEVTPQGLVVVNDDETLQTTKPNVFCGGDIALGPKLFINAVESEVELLEEFMLTYLKQSL